MMHLIRQILGLPVDKPKPLDLQSFDEALLRLHTTVKTSAREITKEVDLFARMVRDMREDRQAPPAKAAAPTKKTATTKRRGAKR